MAIQKVGHDFLPSINARNSVNLTSSVKTNSSLVKQRGKDLLFTEKIQRRRDDELGDHQINLTFKK